MKTVFVVTQEHNPWNGISFTEILSAFSNYKDARDYLRYKCNASPDFTVKEIPLDSEIDKSEKMWTVQMSLYGECLIGRTAPVKWMNMDDETIRYFESDTGKPMIAFTIRGSSYKNAEKRARKRLSDVLRLENNRFPYLRERIVHDKLVRIDRPTYPIYVFKSGEILLGRLERLDENINAKVKEYDRR